VEIILLINAKQDDALLLRIALIFHRFSVDIKSITMRCSKKTGRARLRIAVNHELVHAQRLIANLYKILAVESVAVLPGLTCPPVSS
jgi:acetolactate synthase regulatory subunit